MKKFTVLFAATFLVSSLLTQNLSALSLIPYADNRQQFRQITDAIKNCIKDETLTIYPKVKKVGVRAQETLINFDAENSTVEYQITIETSNAIMDNNHLLSGELAKTSQTIRVSEQLFTRLQNEQSRCCSIL